MFFCCCWKGRIRSTKIHYFVAFQCFFMTYFFFNASINYLYFPNILKIGFSKGKLILSCRSKNLLENSSCVLSRRKSAFWNIIYITYWSSRKRFLREAAKKVIFLVAWPLRGWGKGVRAGSLRKKNLFFNIFGH